LRNLEDVIASRELVQVRFKVEKKKEAKDIGEKISLETRSLLAQVVGHTVLLYRASTPPGKVSKLLSDLIEAPDLKEL
jgi:RNA-binding protein YhbY